MSRSLAMTSAFSFLGIYVRTMGIPIYVGIMASIPYVRANGDTPIDFILVVLEAHKTLGSSSTHFPLAECRPFFRANKRVLLDVFAWLLLCGHCGIEYKFLIFNSLQNFMYTQLSNCSPLSITIDWVFQTCIQCSSIPIEQPLYL